MKITNRHGLPQALVNAVANDPYTMGKSDISVTRLIQPPQISYLAQGIELEEDVSDRIWALLGQSVHTILERAYVDSNAIVEHRFYADCLGWKVSGQLDVLDEGVLSDWKITSVYARDGKIEWERQLNLLACLCRLNRQEVTKAQIVAIFRDWRPKEALRDDYPDSQVAVIPVKLWEPLIASQYMQERVRLHQQITPPPCTDEERWLQPSKWALMKKGQKKAVKLFDLKPDNIILDDKQYWEKRPGVYRRCESYCSVSTVCRQWRTTLEDARRDSEEPGSELPDVAPIA